MENCAYLRKNPGYAPDPNWREADQLAIYKRSREVELGATENNIG